MNDQSDYVTILVVGDTGAGKSTLGNAFLNIENAFEESSEPESCTFITSSKSHIIGNIKRYYIDTQGFNSSDGLDASYIQQMVQFLKAWKLGINAFFIVINVQNPRFDQNVQKMLKLMNDFFNNPEFWKQTGIVFTKCYKKKFNREISEKRFKQRVVDLIKTFDGCQNLNLQMPTFFVDSPEIETDEDTKFEFIRLFEFAHKNQPVPTIKLATVSPKYKYKEKVILNRQLIKTELQGTGRNRIQVFYYADKMHYKITDWNNEVTFTPLETIIEWTESQPMPEADKKKEKEIIKRKLIKTEMFD